MHITLKVIASKIYFISRLGNICVVFSQVFRFIRIEVCGVKVEKK